METPAELRLQPDQSRYTLGHFLADVCARFGDRPALHFEGRETSYRELESEARRVARGLVAAGVSKGSRVAVLIPNRPEWAVAAFGVGMVGAVLVPVSTFGTPEEIDGILRHSDASVLLMQQSLLNHRYREQLERRHPEIKNATPGQIRCPSLPALRRVYCMGERAGEGGIETFPDLLSAGTAIAEKFLDALIEQVKPSDDGILIYTSGTTAQPKGVLHRQRAAVIQSWRFAEHYELQPQDVVLTAQPFFWTAGICMSLGATLAGGGRLVLQENFEPEAALDAIEKLRVTTVFAWPHQETAMASLPGAAERDLRSVEKLNHASPLAALCGIDEDRWGTSGSYGLSETFTLASAIPARSPAALREKTAGRPLPGMQIRIVDPETGEPVATGERGEIAVKGITLMKGYHKVDPELYLDAEGFFRTQDGGYFDDEGYLYWEGRLGNLIKTGGANVSPLEIEEALRSYPGLWTAHAVGVPHPTWGEIVVLCAVATGEGGEEVTEDAIRAFLRMHLAIYKVPRRVLFFQKEELALTANQKIQAGPLREAAKKRLVADGAAVDGYRYHAADIEGTA